MAEELGERTEQPTARRLSEARGRGQVAKSQDLGAAVDLTAAFLVIAAFGGTALGMLGSMMRRVLQNEAGGDPRRAEAIGETVASVARDAAWILVPGLAVMFAAACVAQLGQVGWLFTTEPLKPKFSKLNPINGVKKIVGLRNVVRTSVNVWKLAAIMIVATLVIRSQLPELVALPKLTMTGAMYMLALKVLEVVLWLLPLLLVLGFIDWLYQRWQHTRDLRMTRQEVKDERRSSEGDPDVKRRRYKMAYEIALQRIQHAVPKADVVVTNPTHFSVALRYDAATMRAPKVIAKGADHMAFRIRQVAIASGVPLVERPPLARALYAGVEVGQEIRPEFYEAVAEVLAYVYRLAGRAA